MANLGPLLLAGGSKGCENGSGLSDESTRVIAPSNVTFHAEPISSAWDEAQGLILANFTEVGGLDPKKFAPKREQFERMDALGFMRCFTMRKLGRLVGYAIFVVMPTLNYPEITMATSHVVYVSPEHRGRAAVRFIVWTDAMLEREGAHVIARQSPVKHDQGRTYLRMGYRQIEMTYIREVS